MAYPIEKKLVIAVASSALFDLTESDSIFKAQGVQPYKEYQKKYIDKPFEKGVAFPFISRLLRLNESFPDEQPIEVILMSRNSPETGMRAFNSIKHYQLNITRAGFSSGSSHFQYLPAFNASLFLSANESYRARIGGLPILDWHLSLSEGLLPNEWFQSSPYHCPVPVSPLIY